MTKNEFKLYNEILYINIFYEKIKINPKMKVKSLIGLYTKCFIGVVIFILYLIFCYIYGNKDIYYIIYACFLSLFLLVSIYYLFLCIRMKKRMLKTTDIKMSEEGFKDLEENKIIKWENVIAITINKYSICLIPKDWPTNNIMYWEINQKEEVIKTLKKYDKLDLLVDNSALYD